MNVLVAVCGSIAGVKAPELLAGLAAAGHDVKVILTPGAVSLFGADFLSDYAPETTDFPPGVTADDYLNGAKIRHIELAKWADMVLGVGVSANALSRLARGAADDLFSATVLATTAPVALAPAMNPAMWAHPALVQNCAKVLGYGYFVIDPVHGQTACGDVGTGRMAPVSYILEQVSDLLKAKKHLRGKYVAVTAGAAWAPVDDVRGLTNRSSGALGAALAEYAVALGARVTHILTPGARPARGVSERIFATENEDFADALKALQQPDYVLHTAALSDFFIMKNDGKMDSRTPQKLLFQPAEKLVESLRDWHAGVVLVGWKAVASVEEEELINDGKALLQRGKLDAVVANPLSTMGSENSQGVFITKNGVKSMPERSKRVFAKDVWTAILGL